MLTVFKSTISIFLIINCAISCDSSSFRKPTAMDSFRMAREAREKAGIKEKPYDPFDTTGLYESVIKVTKASIVQQEYSNYRNVQLTFKNTSRKKVSAVRFRWYGENAFSEGADMGNNMIRGYGGGGTDSPIGPGKSKTLTWNILSRDAKKLVLAWPTEIVFADGDKWEL